MAYAFWSTQILQEVFLPRWIISISVGTSCAAEWLLNIWWRATELLEESVQAVSCSSVLAILRWTLWDSRKIMYTTEGDQEVSLSKFMLWQYGAERIYDLSYLIIQENLIHYSVRHKLPKLCCSVTTEIHWVP